MANPRKQSGARKGRLLRGMNNTIDFNGKFQPTELMIEFMNTYLAVLARDGKAVKPYEILSKEMGRNPQNWYNWQSIAGFTQWFLDRRASFHETVGIANVHDAIYENALKDSAQDRKLHLERFDAKYKPRTEQSFVFAGSRPIDNMSEEEIVERSRKQVESVVI